MTNPQTDTLDQSVVDVWVVPQLNHLPLPRNFLLQRHFLLIAHTQPMHPPHTPGNPVRASQARRRSARPCDTLRFNVSRKHRSNRACPRIRGEAGLLRPIDTRDSHSITRSAAINAVWWEDE